MKVNDVLKKLLTSSNLVSQAPIYEKYDKNVQGNTVHERGQVAASITVPFRDFAELPNKESKTGVTIATGGNPNLAKISAREATRSAVAEALIKLACVGGIPLGATDCLNFGNPEKAEQMGEFVEGIEGLKEACEVLKVPIVSGNVSLYNETRGKSIPPSALIAVFGRVDEVVNVPKLAFQKEGETIFLVGKRSNNLGGSEFLKACKKEDTRIPKVDLEALRDWTSKLRGLAQENVITTANPVQLGGMITALAKSCIKGSFGAKINIPTENIPQFLFSEDLGVLITTENSERIKSTFGDEAIELGVTTKEQKILVQARIDNILEYDLNEVKEAWENKLREII